jgi:alkanesulfonate monooxygenase SsuD/methylene tetrahydromethanopterin reductase-like flavin-dependent oxidoreductase (luciferase family)
LPLVAEFGDEWNAVSAGAERFATLSSELDTLLDRQGRPREAVKRTMMTRVVVGRSDAEAEGKLNGDPQALRERGVVFGVPSAIVDQLGRLAEAGVSRVMTQWLDMDDIDGLELLAAEVLPKLGSS